MTITVVRRYKKLEFGNLANGELFRLADNNLLGDLYHKRDDSFAYEFACRAVKHFAFDDEIVRVDANLEWWDA